MPGIFGEPSPKQRRLSNSLRENENSAESILAVDEKEEEEEEEEEEKEKEEKEEEVIKVTNQEVIEFFKKQSTAKYFETIISGLEKSERHDTVLAGVTDTSAHAIIVQMGNSNYLEDIDDFDMILIELTGPIFDEKSTLIGLNSGRNLSFYQKKDFKDKYLKYVLIPEGIIKCIMEKNEPTMQCDRKKADNHFQLTSHMNFNENDMMMDISANDDSDDENREKQEHTHNTYGDSEDEELPDID
jgi:hypothetical protein